MFLKVIISLYYMISFQNCQEKNKLIFKEIGKRYLMKTFQPNNVQEIVYFHLKNQVQTKICLIKLFQNQIVNRQKGCYQNKIHIYFSIFTCCIMDIKNLHNPYKNVRIPIITTKPLLTHEDRNCSLYKYLSKKKRLYTSQEAVSDRQIEERILWKYQKQYYGQQLNRCSLALRDFKKIHQQTQRQDLLQIPFFGGKILRDHLTNCQTASNQSFQTQYLEQNSRKIHENESKKLHWKSLKQTNRQQINKIKSKLKQKQDYYIKRQKDSQFSSVLNLYRAKKVEQFFSSLVSFGQVEPGAKTQSIQKLNEIKIVVKTVSSQKKLHPQIISFENQKYFKVPII